jgi:hypothetical protein
MENEQWTKELEEKSRREGLPIFKNVEKKDADKSLVFNEEDD